jgi:hypothetical protein
VIAARPRLALALLCVLFAASGVFVHPMGIAGADEFRNNDWLNCRSFDVLTRRALLEDGEWPLRTHLLGGGFPVAAHPSDGSWAPTIVAVLLFGDVIGVKINLILFLIAGAWGVHALARKNLRLSEEASVLAGALFALSGWLPSMWLVGFYNQVFYLLVPGILHLYLQRRWLPAGVLLFFVLQQGGHAFPAIAYALGWVACGVAALERRDARPLLLVPAVTVPAVFARELHAAWPWAVAVALVGGGLMTASVRGFLRALLPWGLRLGLLLAVCCSLGAPRLAGLALLERNDSEYEHTLQRRDALWFPDPPTSPIPNEERFYPSLPAFLRALSGRVPAETDYLTTDGRPVDPIEPEYAWLGLTPPFALLALLGLLLALGPRRRDRRAQATAAGTVLFALICFGPRAPPDLHFLLTWGVPHLDDFAQPIKYWNFFVLLGAVLLAAFAVDALPGRRRLLPVAALLLIWPLLQNRAALAELFLHERPPGPPASAYEQHMLIADPSWIQHDDAWIRDMSDRQYLRDYIRPRNGTEYFNLRRGVATLNHYGSIVLPENAIPSTYVMLDGRELPNPRYRGEAWVANGVGRVLDVRVRHNSIRVSADLETSAAVVINQSALPGFEAEGGALATTDGGQLALLLPAGRHEATLRYRPPRLLRAFALAGASAMGWSIFGLVSWRRRRIGVPPPRA